jgi:hypothetical protein
MTRRLVTLILLGLACDKKPDKAAPAPSVASLDASRAAMVLPPVEIPELGVKADATSEVHVTWSAPMGTDINEDAPFRVRWNRSDGLAEAPSDVRATGSAAKDGFSVHVRPMPGAPNAVLTGEIDLVVCDVATHSVCVPVKRALELGFVVVKDGPTRASVTVPLPHAK